MRAMILAAGRGERMRPLTDKTPKPLLEIAGKPLIVYQLQALQRAGITEVVINLGHLGNQVRDFLKEGDEFGLSINYSDEGENTLETAGGIIKALPLLGNDAFIVTNADIFTDFDYAALVEQPDSLAHLVLVDNPEHNPEGDFVLNKGLVENAGPGKLTYSGIGIFKPEFFDNCDPGRRALAPLLRQFADAGRVSGVHYKGEWSDVGTPARLKELNV